MTRPFRAVVLLSGYGSNLQALLDAGIPATISAVLSDNPNAYGLTRAQLAGIPTHVLTANKIQKRQSYDASLLEHLETLQPDLIILAGYMRIIGPAVLTRYPKQIINIHPSLLPKYPGLHTFQRALEAGDTITGATVHYVTDVLDGGPIIAQARCPILPGDTEDSLRQRVHTQEYALYPTVVTWIANNLIQFDKDGLKFADSIASHPYREKTPSARNT